MSTYSTTLRLELIGAGEQDGTWGDTTNSNLGDLIEAAITNKVDITFANATYTLTAFNGLPDEARNAVLNLVGTNSGAQNLIAPAVEKTYIVKNATGATVTIKTSGGTGVAVATGTTVQVWCDGTDFYASTIPTGASTGTGSIVFSASPTLTGTPLAPTAANGTNTTQIATTSFVNSAVTIATGSLGTMSTQNANAVSITGGSITGITDLAVADGGTGASTLAANAVLLGNGTSAVQTVSPGTSGNVLTSNGTTWASTAPQSFNSDVGTVTNGGTFTFTTGSTGKALLTVQSYSIGNYGNFGNTTSSISIGGSTVASQDARNMEYDGRTSGGTAVILYKYSGSANATITVTFNWSGSGSFVNASYMYLGL